MTQIERWANKQMDGCTIEWIYTKRESGKHSFDIQK